MVGEDGETGYLATPGDVGSLRRVIVRLIEDPDKCEHMGRTAQKLTSMRWSAKTHREAAGKLSLCRQGFGRGTSQRQVWAIVGDGERAAGTIPQSLRRWLPAG